MLAVGAGRPHAQGCGFGQPCSRCRRHARYGDIVRAIGPCPVSRPDDPPEITELRIVQWDGLDALAGLMRTHAAEQLAHVLNTAERTLAPPAAGFVHVLSWPTRIDLMPES